jgi:hypothetical protein
MNDRLEVEAGTVEELHQKYRDLSIRSFHDERYHDASSRVIRTSLDSILKRPDKTGPLIYLDMVFMPTTGEYQFGLFSVNVQVI